jgi:predicted MFS family arabinose efflux permease
MMPRRVPPLVWTILGSSAVTTLGVLPVFLLSSQSVFVREDLGFGETRFGIAVSVFFASAAVTALLGGKLADRLGRRTCTLMSGLLGAAGCFGVALAPTWPALLVALIVTGVANAACQVTSNLTMARAVPVHRQGLGFGVKQAAIPLSIVLSGLAVPLTSDTIGWAGTFVITGTGGVCVALAALRIPVSGPRTTLRAQPDDQPPRGALLLTMGSIALGSAAANSFGAFIASWGFEVGLTPSQAGVLMAVGSGLNILARLLSGHLADRRFGRNLPLVATQMVIGGLCLAAMTLATPAALVPATLVAFAVGWSWPGLLLFAVVRISRDAPAAASGIVQAGAFVGGAAGPAIFGVVAGAAGYRVAWSTAAIAFLLGSAMIMVARRAFVADLTRRPPPRQIGYGGGRHHPRHLTDPQDS